MNDHGQWWFMEIPQFLEAAPESRNAEVSQPFEATEWALGNLRVDHWELMIHQPWFQEVSYSSWLVQSFNNFQLF